MIGTNTVETLAETQHRLENYRRFVDEISRALGVPDDSLILPYATDLRRQLAECQARCNRMESFCAVHGVESTTQNHPLPPVSDGALWPGCFDGEVEL